MIKLFLVIFLTLFSLKPTFAQSNSYVTVINPVRGEEFWDVNNQKPVDGVIGQAEILTQNNIPATWLLRFDALNNKEIIETLKNLPGHEKGLFLEVIPTLTNQAKVEYRKSPLWHLAGSVFLTGYAKGDREKLINADFERFKEVFGAYPKSVGAWWIDGYSLGYMREKYKVTSALIVADQFSTDNYQIWGQYFGTPFYPDKDNNLNPTQSATRKLPVVVVQWAARDPINGYGKGVEDSTYSVQANDYTDYHKLQTDYFGKLVDIYTKQEFNQFGHLVVGLENSYSWNKYRNEYENQIKVLVEKKNKNQFSITTLQQFSDWYRNKFPDISPSQIIVANDPLGTDKKAIWFMNPFFRALSFYNGNDFSIVDLRQYVQGEKELCKFDVCDEINFATFATRVLDNVTYGHKWQIDTGKIKDLNFKKEEGKFVIGYTNQLEKTRKIEFLPRDISIDGTIYTIDGAILNATLKNTALENKDNKPLEYFFSTTNFSLNFIKFIIFTLLFIFIPGRLLINKMLEDDNTFSRIFLSIISGIVMLTTFSYIAGMFKIWWIVYLYAALALAIALTIFLRFKPYRFTLVRIDKWILLNILVIILGTIFQNIPVFKSGTLSSIGMGFWGPNTHDGVWHMALVDQIIKGLPLQNPIFSGESLTNYHYFYDLLIGISFIVTKIPIVDLIFRFYPVLFSMLLGVGTYFLSKKLFASKGTPSLSLFFVYFTGSFGWIVEYIREKHFGGESAFWINQPVSFNLNPPFAISLLLVIAIIYLVFLSEKRTKGAFFLLAFFSGVLIGFKTYAAILVISSFFVLGIFEFLRDRNFYFLKIFAVSLFLSVLILLPNFKFKNLFIFSPFWFIHSMVDSPDRVGWVRLSLARMASLEQGNWLKFILAEFLGLVIFIGGNLGVRIISLILIFKINFLKNNGYFFIFVFTLISFIIPMLFIQVGNPWNTIQFSYYSLYTTAVILGGILSWIYFKLAFPVNLLIFLIMLIAPINAITTMKSYLYPIPHGVIGTGELAGLNFLSGKPDGTILTYPFDRDTKNNLPPPLPFFAYETTAYVSALSSKQTFVADEIQNEILQTNYKDRLNDSKTFFNDLELNFLQKNNIRYIYIPTYFKIVINEGKLIKKIYQNSEVNIYEVVDKF